MVAPTREDPVARSFAAVLGGPAGWRRAAVQRGWWTAARVLVGLAVVAVALGVVQKEHCRVEGWSSPDQFFHACYSDLPAMYQTAGLHEGLMPYLQPAGGTHLGQPVLTGTVMWAVAKVVPGGDLAQQTRWYMDLSTILVALLFRTIDAVRMFDLPRVLTNGGPGQSTETVVLYAYNTLFTSLNFGYGSALAVMTFLTVLIISFIYIKVLGTSTAGGRS